MAFLGGPVVHPFHVDQCAYPAATVLRGPAAGVPLREAADVGHSFVVVHLGDTSLEADAAVPAGLIEHLSAGSLLLIGGVGRDARHIAGIFASQRAEGGVAEQEPSRTSGKASD